MVFEGITNEYRQTDEYKTFVSSVKGEFPSLPLYLIEMGIAMHKHDPQYYKEATKKEKRGEFSRADTLVDLGQILEDSVKVYKDESELPPVVPVKVRGEAE